MSAPPGAVVSTVLAPLVDGPRQTLTVAHRGRHAWQLANSRGQVVACVINRLAIRLPYAAVVPSFPRASSPVSVGDGSLGWDGSRIPIVRWWRPARPSLPCLSSVLDESAVSSFVEHWDDWLGRGAGLTPDADDLVCGSLVLLHAAGHPAAPDLRRRVHRSDLSARTTATSAGLLRLAADGYCVDPVAVLLESLAAGRGVGAACAEVERIGHSSGFGLVEGVVRLLSPELRAAARARSAA